MLIRVTTVQKCDATEDPSSNAADTKNLCEPCVFCVKIPLKFRFANNMLSTYLCTWQQEILPPNKSLTIISAKDSPSMMFY